MRGLIPSIAVSAILLLASVAMATPNPADDHSTVVIIYKDGHRQSLAMAEVARIDMNAPAQIVYKDGHKEKIAAIDRIEFGESGVTANMPSRNHYLGKWEVGEGNGSHFFITLEPNGDAKKTLGEEHGTWTWVDGEAHIAWDDGWHDAIRKVGAKHEKVAHEPGTSFNDPPSNVTEAHNTEPKPI
jgi:hypothetical protein